MNVGRVVSRGYRGDHVFALLVPKGLKKLLVFMCRVKRSRSTDHLKKITLQVDVSDAAAIEAESSKNLLEIPFSLVRFEILRVSYSFCNESDSFWRNNVTKKVNFFQEK